MLGSVLESKYELLRLLGEGGMGAVYEARHLQIGRHVAIKLMGAAVAQSEEARRRFLREAQVAGALDHENICPVTDMGATPEGVPYLVMPLLKGHNLTEELASRRGPVPLERSVDIVCQVLAGLEVAHAANVLHRDLKPDNIFLVKRPDKPDLVKLLDFGISKIVSPLGTSTELTGTGMVVGTPAYLAPEQAMATRELDQRVDVYGAAVVLYQLVTGRRPFEARSYNEMIVKICTEPFPPPRTWNGMLDPALEQVLLRGMAREPDERWASAGAFRQALLALRDSTALRGMQGTALLAAGAAAAAGDGAQLATGPASATTPGPPPMESPDQLASQATVLATSEDADPADPVATAHTLPLEQSADLAGLAQTPTAAGQADLRASAVHASPSPRGRGGLWGGIIALVGVAAGAGVVLLYLTLRVGGPQPERSRETASDKSPSPDARAAIVPAATPPVVEPPREVDPRPRPASVDPPVSADPMTPARPRSRARRGARSRPRPRARPRRSAQPYGGKTAYLSTTYGGKIYRIPYMRAQAARLLPRINRCYAAAQYNGVMHQFATWRLRISDKGGLERVRLIGRAIGKTLNNCVKAAFHSISWDAPYSGTGGWFRLGFTSRVPRKRVRRQ